MLTVHIKVIELLTQEKHTSMNPLNIFAVCSGALDTKLFKLKIVKGKDDNALKCQKSILYNLPTQNKNFLCLELKRHRVIVADDNLGKLTLPLSWFPTNHVVREWFPFKAASKKVKDAMILLDVHVDARKAAPFMAPFASLRVFPCWNRPTQTINSDFPISPPMVYVISSAEQRTIPLQQLRMMVSQQQINPAPPQILPNAQPLTQNYNPVIATQSQLNPNINLQQQQQPIQITITTIMVQIILINKGLNHKLYSLNLKLKYNKIKYNHHLKGQLLFLHIQPTHHLTMILTKAMKKSNKHMIINRMLIHIIPLQGNLTKDYIHLLLHQVINTMHLHISHHREIHQTIQHTLHLSIKNYYLFYFTLKIIQIYFFYPSL